MSTEPGHSFPIGARPVDGGVNFSVHSRCGTAVDLLFFDHVEAVEPSRVVPLSLPSHRTGAYWHAFVPGVGHGQVYAYRVHGPRAPERGHRFDPDKVLLDPYGRCVGIPPGYRRRAAIDAGPNDGKAMKSIVVDTTLYDWEGDEHPRHPFEKSVIYELHVRGFTRHPSSGVADGRRGTFAGLIDRIPYLVDLGVSAVELLPVFQFDPQDCPPGLANYWGYSPVSFFAPHAGYGSVSNPLGVVDEFRDMVKALHRAGIEVILDVVFNHTAEGCESGPTICFRGFDNRTYYLLDPDDPSRCQDFTGCGNTLNANHPVVRRMIIDSLHYWVRDMHVDGFRFDLASILSRDEDGKPTLRAPVIRDIDTDPVLCGAKLIAEAWDAGGLYQVGSFAGDSWSEWNGAFRDDVRGFLRGDNGMVRRFAGRMFGSPDIYAAAGRGPEQSVNFVTCHDGFTLNDLVSYEHKHNEANGEGNRDGSDENRSWNCGVEGPTADPEIEALRERQIRNFFAVLLLSFGTPMILMGDEVRRSQGGNNNAFCQDNETSWLDWSLVERNRGLHRYVRGLVTARRRFGRSRDWFGITLRALLERAQVEWSGIRLGRPDWSDSSHSIACTWNTADGRFRLHVMLNAWREALTFELPEGGRWKRWIDTAGHPPDDLADPHDAPEVADGSYTVAAHAVVVVFQGDVPADPKARRLEESDADRARAGSGLRG